MRVWTVSEVKAGTLTQCLGVGRHFDPEPHQVTVADKLGWWAKGPLSPYRWTTESEPKLIISCGRMAPQHVFAIADSCRRKPFTVHLQTPQQKFADRYDFAFIGRHDWTEATADHPNFHRMIGAPHQITHDALSELRSQARAKLLRGERAVAVVLGGPTQAFRFEQATVDGLIRSISALAEQGWTALVSTSRRSPPGLLAQLLSLRHDRIVVWDRAGENPYREFLAAADAVLVTKDSVTMACEALATGRPVYILDLPGVPGKKFDKFERFHADLAVTLGLTRPFEGHLDAYDYVPLDEARRIAIIIAAGLEARRSAFR